MRTLGLFNLAYGTTGLVSSVRLDRIDGSAVSMWVILCGAVAFLGLVPGHVMLQRALAGIRR